jgi:hypothetical protein
MLIAIIILSLFLILLGCIWELHKYEIQQTIVPFANPLTPVKKEQLSSISEDIVVGGTTDMMFANVWWSKLTTIQQLQLALDLCQKALPVWEKYTGAKEMVYHSSTTSAVNKIDHKILHKAIEEIKQASQFQFPDKSNKKINNGYSDFVYAVIAMQDGFWLPSYPAKKIFMAVYNILKSIVEQNNASGIATNLSVAINLALDCIDITKLYTHQEIDSFFAIYKNKL